MQTHCRCVLTSSVAEESAMAMWLKLLQLALRAFEDFCLHHVLSSLLHGTDEQRRRLPCQAPLSHFSMQNAAPTGLWAEYSNKAGIGGKLLVELMGDLNQKSLLKAQT